MRNEYNKIGPNFYKIAAALAVTACSIVIICELVTKSVIDNKPIKYHTLFNNNGYIIQI